MTSSYLLLEPLPGRSGDVLEALSAMPQVQATQELFGEKVAARLEVDDDLDDAASAVEGLESVAWACLYGDEEPRRRLHASG